MQMSDLLARVADVMRRCDPEYWASHEVPQTTEAEWDDCLMDLEDADVDDSSIELCACGGILSRCEICGGEGIVDTREVTHV